MHPSAGCEVVTCAAEAAGAAVRAATAFIATSRHGSIQTACIDEWLSVAAVGIDTRCNARRLPLEVNA